MKDLSEERRAKIDAMLTDVGRALLRHDAAFFMPSPVNVWMDGEFVGTILHQDDGCGHEFELTPRRGDRP